jgi:hypothetical protein
MLCTHRGTLKGDMYLFCMLCNVVVHPMPRIISNLN